MIRAAVLMTAMLAVATASTDTRFVAMPPGWHVTTDGYFGFRFGKDMNVHASRLDLTHKLAPVPSK